MSSSSHPSDAAAAAMSGTGATDAQPEKEDFMMYSEMTVDNTDQQQRARSFRTSNIADSSPGAILKVIDDGEPSSPTTSGAGAVAGAAAATSGHGPSQLPETSIVSQVPAHSIGVSTDPSGKSLTPEERNMRMEEESFYSAPDNKAGDDNIWGLLSGVGGNVYEWYDFAVYGLLASEIGGCFFPKSSKELQLINSFGVYLAAFVMRPLGAICFGELGDRLVGRKNALVFSIVLITVPSVLMGILPTYNMWGPAAPICLVFLRMLQGLSVGGQLAGSYVLSIEQSSSKNRGFRGSICDASSVGGFLLASSVTTIVRKSFSEEAVNNWAWRLPFLFSLVLAPLLYYIVKQTEESKFWAESKEQKETEKVIRENEEKSQTPAIVDLVSSPFRRRQLLGMIGVLCPLSSSYYTLFLWSPVYLSELRGLLSEGDADMINVFVIASYISLLLLGGKLSDVFPHRMDLIRIGCPGVIVAAPVMFAMYESESKFGYFLGQLQYAACLSLFQGGMAAWKVELWMSDPTLSFTGVAIGHNVTACLFGGTLPLVATFLFYRASDWIPEDDGELGSLWPRLIPGLYISLLGCISLYSISFVIRHPHDVRTGEKKLRDVYNREVRRKIRIQQKNEKRRRQKQKELGAEGYWTNALSSPVTSWEALNPYAPPTSSP